MANRGAATAVVFACMAASAAVMGWLEGSFSRVGDVWAFADSGSTLLSTHALHAFHVPAIQAGPLELVLASVARTLGGGHTGFAIVLDVACWAAVSATAWSLLDRRPLDLAVFGAAACALALPAEGYRGHPAELAIACLWLLAAREARRGRTALAGCLVGAASCFEVWGILGVATLVLAPSLRRCIPAVALAAAIPALCFVPFAAAGDFHMFAFAWPALRAPAALIVGRGNPFTWQLRVAQAVLVVAAGGAAARLTRRLPESIWIVPAVVMLVRISLDPITYGYYYDPALVALLLGATRLGLHPRALAERLRTHLPDVRGRAPAGAVPTVAP